MFCSSCGHDNPSENRYCGMCGTPFPHRFLPVPEEQSALTFPSAALEIAPSPLPVPTPEVPQLETTAASAAVEESEIASISRPPAPVVSPSEAVEEAEPIVAAEPSGATPAPIELPHVEPEPVVVIEKLATAPEIIPVKTSEREPSPAPGATEPAAPLQPAAQEEVSHPAQPPLPEIRKYATPHREAPPVRVDTDSGTPSTIRRPPPPQTMEPPPDSAGMPTFQSVAEASGAPAISPFEPPVKKSADEERELQEFVASFRYHPPDEAVDELTMRSEVPVLDAEAPVTPSHPSFDDDVPPPPEAGPHPTGEEYYPPTGSSADRSRYLEIADTHQAAPSQPASTSATTSFLGLDDSPPADVPPPNELEPPVRRHWMLWTSLLALLAIFGALGFFEGRAEVNHAYRGSIEIVREQYAKLRQRISDLTRPAPSSPATTAENRASEPPAVVEPKAEPKAPDQPQTDNQAQPESPAKTNPEASSATQPTVPPDQQQPKPTVSSPQSTPAPDTKAAATASVPAATVTPQKPPVETQPKPAPDATAAKREAALQPPPAVAKPKSKPDPGQQELANAVQASDPAAEAAWLWKATSRGNPVAPVRLADMYIKGKGVPHSCEQALVLLRSEAAKENAPARNRLAALYANGTCVARDRVKAYQLMSSALAVDPGSEWAEQNRKELWQQMTPEERAQAEKYH